MRIKTLPKKLGRILISIDVANVAIGLRRHGLAFDFENFLKQIKEHGKIIGAHYYGPTFDDPRHENFLVFLKKTGYKLHTKPVKVISGQGHEQNKANFDVEITIDALDKRDEFDTLILLSGDSDFAALLRYLGQKEKKRYVLSTRGSISWELIDQSDGYLVLNEWKTILRKRSFTKKDAKASFLLSSEGKKSPRRKVGGRD